MKLKHQRLFLGIIFGLIGFLQLVLIDLIKNINAILDSLAILFLFTGMGCLLWSAVLIGRFDVIEEMELKPKQKQTKRRGKNG